MGASSHLPQEPSKVGGVVEGHLLLDVRHGRVDDAFARFESTATHETRNVADLARDLPSFGELPDLLLGQRRSEPRRRQ